MLKWNRYDWWAEVISGKYGPKKKRVWKKGSESSFWGMGVTVVLGTLISLALFFSFNNSVLKFIFSSQNKVFW